MLKSGSAGAFAETTLPWGLDIRYHPDETIGASIWRAGVFDISVSETIWRLLDEGEHVLDVGANIGYMTSIMAKRVGRHGSISAFEPHPEIFAELQTNIEKWQDHKDVCDILAYQIALSDKDGVARLNLGECFDSNRGTASLNDSGHDSAGRSVDVEAKTLSGFFGSGEKFGLMKIDVEGHEMSVFRGGEELFRRHQIRDIVFEEHDTPPTPVTEFLQDCGYTIFFVTKGFLGLQVYDLASLPERNPFESPNYVATTDPERTMSRLKKKGWSLIGYLNFS